MQTNRNTGGSVIGLQPKHAERDTRVIQRVIVQCLRLIFQQKRTGYKRKKKIYIYIPKLQCCYHMHIANPQSGIFLPPTMNGNQNLYLAIHNIKTKNGS